ncbi:MAG: T9SS type A sorting domain-containing protein [Nonlabens sp.]
MKRKKIFLTNQLALLLLAVFTFTFSQAQNIQQIEYFYGNNPAVGAATAITVQNNNGEVQESFTFPVIGLNAGYNLLHIRAQDDLGVWGLYDKQLFYVFEVSATIPIAPIADAIYLYDDFITTPRSATISVNGVQSSGSNTAIIPTANTDEYIIQIPTDMVDCGFHDISLSIENTDGTNSILQIAQNIEVLDAADPSIVVRQNISIELDASGNATLDISQVDDGTFDDCTLVSVALDQANMTYDCSMIGINTVTVTAMDAASKTSTLDVDITVVDSIDPTASAQDFTVDLNQMPSVTISPGDIDNGSSDNCTIASLSLDQDTFTAVGTYTVILMATDASGNMDTSTATVTVTDILSEQTLELNQKSINVYPNPAESVLFIKTNFDIDRITLFSITGTQVFKSDKIVNSIDVSKFASGLYFLNVEVKGHSLIKKVMVK